MLNKQKRTIQDAISRMKKATTELEGYGYTHTHTRTDLQTLGGQPSLSRTYE